MSAGIPCSQRANLPGGLRLPGASAAMSLLVLRKPEWWFGGAACLCGSFPKLRVPSHRFNDLRNKRILLTTSAANRSSGVGDVVAAGRLLYASGMQIGTRVYQEAGISPTSKMLRDVNHWLMDDVCSIPQRGQNSLNRASALSQP